MITKFEKQVVALVLAATMCLAAVLSCGAAVYAGEGESEPAAEMEMGESVARFDDMSTTLSVSSEETLVVPSEETSVVPSEETSVATSEEAEIILSKETPIVTSEGGSATMPEEIPIEEIENEDDAVAGDIAENGQKAARASATEGDYEYDILTDGSVVISKYNGTETEVSIPGTLGGKNVGSIGELAFKDNQTIEKVTLPASVTSIQYLAFGGCTNLKNVELSGNNLKTIGDRAFWSSGLTEFTSPSVEMVGEDAFCGCSDLEIVVFGTQLSSLGEYAFSRSGVRSIQISESVLSHIENGTFSGCGNLSQIKLPNSIKSIGDSAFSSSGLETIQIPNSVEEIGAWAFYYCQKLAIVELSSSLKKIGERAFGDSGLVAIEIPNSVEEIGMEAFYGCRKLSSAMIGNGVTVVGVSAFENCALTTVTIGERVEVIDDCAFAGNKELSKVVIPQNVTRLEYAAFVDCEALAEITFPDALTKIDGWALDGTAWYAGKVDGVVYAGKVMYHYKGDMPAETSVKLRDGTKGIAGFAFYACKNLKEVEIPEGVTNIGRFAFYDAGLMSSVRIPASVTEIGRMALGYFESLNGTYFVDDNNCHVIYEKIPGFTIYGQTGSAAQKYAQENGFIFVAEDPKLEIVLNVTDKVYLIGSDSNATIKCTGELKDFVNVAVDGQLVDPSCYIVSEGSTVLTFLSSYLDTLSVGDHVVTLNYTYGSIDTVLTVLDRNTGNAENTNQNGNANDGNANHTNGAPKTGDATSLWTWWLLFLFSSAGILTFALKKKKQMIV